MLCHSASDRSGAGQPARPKTGDHLQPQFDMVASHAERCARQHEVSRPLTVEEREAEKARLQTLVNSFAKSAVRGRPCTYLRESGTRCETEYRLDRGLEYLIVGSSAEDSPVPESSCKIAGIQDIYSIAEDGSASFPREVLASLRPEEQSLLLMVVYRSRNDRLLRLCILEESSSSRDAFLECLRILCIYAQSAMSQAVEDEPPEGRDELVVNRGSMGHHKLPLR